MGRLAVVVAGHPDIFPINYVVDHASIVIRTAAGTKLAGSKSRQVAFEAATTCPTARLGASS